MPLFKDYNQKVKKTFNATSNVSVLTVNEAGRLLGISKDEMKRYVDENNLTKVPVARSFHRYLLLKSEMEAILENTN